MTDIPGTADDLLDAIDAAWADQDAQIAEVLADAAWDAADELDPYRIDPTEGTAA